MSRLSTMSRFKEPDDKEMQKICDCRCGCGTEIYPGDAVFEYDGDYFDCRVCVTVFLEIKLVEAEARD